VNRQIVESALTGLPHRDIAARFGLKLTSVRGVISTAKSLGIDIPSPKNIDRERIIELATKGTPQVEIAAVVGCSVRKVNDLLNRERAAGRDHLPLSRPMAERAASRRHARGMKDRMPELCRAGMSAREISEKFGWQLGSVQQTISRLRAAGVDLPRHRPAPDGEKSRIIEAALTGMPPSKIAVLLGCDRNKVTSVINKERVAGRTFPPCIRSQAVQARGKRGPRGPRDPDMANRIIEAAMTGMRPKDIVALLGCSPGIVSRRLVKERAVGRQIPPFKRVARPQAGPVSRKRVDPAMPAAIIEMAGTGKVPKVISGELGCSLATVYYWIGKAAKAGRKFPQICSRRRRVPVF
jgi:hypothetical protein